MAVLPSCCQEQEQRQRGEKIAARAIFLQHREQESRRRGAAEDGGNGAIIHQRGRGGMKSAVADRKQQRHKGRWRKQEGARL